MTEFVLLAAANARFEVAALGVSFIAMTLVVSSYFFKEKAWFLLFQSLGIVFLILSYLFSGEYFAMVGLSVALARTFVYFLYERKDRTAPVWLAVLFCALSVAAYGVVNLRILQTARPLDVLCLVGLCLNALIFRVKSVKLMRWLAPLATVSSVVYNALIGAPAFTVVSYSFELAANVYAIVKFNILAEKKRRNAKTPT